MECLKVLTNLHTAADPKKRASITRREKNSVPMGRLLNKASAIFKSRACSSFLPSFNLSFAVEKHKFLKVLLHVKTHSSLLTSVDAVFLCFSVGNDSTYYRVCWHLREKFNYEKVLDYELFFWYANVRLHRLLIRGYRYEK